MSKDKVKDGKLYTHCKKCSKFLPYPCKIGVCQKCKVKKFDKTNKQKNTLLNYGIN